MDFNQLDQTLRDSLADLKLSVDERDELRELGQTLSADAIRFLRNRAFALVRELITDSAQAQPALKWLEQVVRTLELRAEAVREPASAHFSPGASCREKILALCREARRSIDVCVFTLSDDVLAQALLDAHRRGLAVRLISDNDKKLDAGSDVRWLREQGLPVRVDRNEHHMHHKFALFDSRRLLNGSFNWTRSASHHNEENFVVIEHAQLVADFRVVFERLWQRYA